MGVCCSAAEVPALTQQEDHNGWAWYRSHGSPKQWTAPLVDYSDLAFRMLCRACGAQVTSTQMLDARKIVTDEAYRAAWLPDLSNSADRPITVQLGGADPAQLAQAAQLAAPFCDAVEINMGCPQQCARRGGYGAFLMEDGERPFECVRATSRALADASIHLGRTVAMLVKIRCFDQVEESVKFAQRLEAAGCMILTVHGRTRKMGGGRHTGQQLARWDWIAEVKRAVGVPVIANGNIRSHADLLDCLRDTAVDGVMAGCGALRDPSTVFLRGGDLVRLDRSAAEEQATTLKKHAAAAEGVEPLTAAAEGQAAAADHQAAEGIVVPAVAKVQATTDEVQAAEDASGAVGVSTHQAVQVTADQCGLRLLAFCRKNFLQMKAQSRARTLLREGAVLLNGEAPAAKGGAVVRLGDTVTLCVEAVSRAHEETHMRAISGTEIKFEDQSVAILHKPCGVRCCVPKVPTEVDVLCIESALPYLLQTVKPQQCFTIVGRGLPRHQSGLVMIAKTAAALEWSANHQERHQAIVVGDVSAAGALPVSCTQVHWAADQSIALSCVEAVVGSSAEWAALLVTLGAAGFPLAGSAVHKGFGKTMCNCCVEMSCGDVVVTITTPPKFDTLFEIVKKRGQAQHCAGLLLTAEPMLQVPDPPISRSAAVLLYLELAARCAVAPAAVHAHLIGRLALVDQKVLSGSALREKIRALENRKTAAEWTAVTGGLGSLTDMKQELSLLLEQSTVMLDDPEQCVAEETIGVEAWG